MSTAVMDEVATESAKKPGIEELTGRALGASNLAVVAHVNGGAAMRVAALAMAERRIAAGADRPVPRPHGMSDALYGQLCAVHREPDPRDAIEALLSRELLAMEAGGQDTPGRRAQAAFLLQARLLQRPEWRRELIAVEHSDAAAAVVRRALGVSGQTISEYLDARCSGKRGCNGTGKQRLLSHGRARAFTVSDRGVVREVKCRSCGGSGLAVPDAGLRAAAVGVSMAEYRNEGWAQRYQMALAILAGVRGRVNRALKRASVAA